jgi:excisionase family DNA binding protein
VNRRTKKEMTAAERWVGAEDVAAHLGVAKDSVYRWIDEQGLPAHRVGRLFRFKLSEIDEWVRQERQQEQRSNFAHSQSSTKSGAKKTGIKSSSRGNDRNG